MSPNASNTKQSSSPRATKLEQAIIEATRDPILQKMLEQERKDRARKKGGPRAADTLSRDPPANAMSGLYHEARKEISPEDQYRALRRQQVRAVVTLQKLFVGRVGPRALRQLLRRQWAATEIARVFRAHCAREYAKQYRRICTCAVIPIQATWRMVKARRHAVAYKKRLVDAVLLVQPSVRGWIARRFVAWKRRDEWAALVVEKIVRGFKARRLFKCEMVRHFHEVVVIPASIDIERVYRGHLARVFAQRKREEKFHDEIVVPASILLQRIWRGKKARLVLQTMRLRNSSAIMIQKVARMRVRRAAYMRILRLKRRNDAATRIASMCRGHLGRALARIYRERQYWTRVMIPSVKTIQNLYRARMARIQVRTLMKKTVATCKLQVTWRRVLARRKLRIELPSHRKAKRARRTLAKSAHQS